MQELASKMTDAQIHDILTGCLICGVLVVGIISFTVYAVFGMCLDYCERQRSRVFREKG